MNSPKSTSPGSSESPWRQLFSGQRGQLALGLLLLQFATAIGVFTLNTVMPAVAEELDGHHWYGFATSSVILATIVTVPLASPLMMRCGLKRTVHAATPVFVLGMLLASLAPAMWAFVAGQMLRGAAGSVLGVLTLSAMVSTFPASLRSRMIALSSSMWIVPAMIGPAYAALVSDVLSWRWALLILLPLVLLARVLVARRLTAYPEAEPGQRGLPVHRALMLGTGALLLLFAAGLPAWTATISALAGAVLVIAGLVRLFPAGTFTLRPGVPAAVLAMFLLCFAFYGAESLVTLMATSDLGTTMFTGGLALTAGAVCRSCASLLQPRLVDHVGLRRTAVVGTVFVATGLAILAANLLTDWPGQTPLILLWAAWAVGGFGMGLCYAPLTVAAFDDDAESQSTAQATSVTLAETTGALLGMTVGGLLIDADAAATGNELVTLAPYVVFAVFMLPVIAATSRIRTRITS